MLFALPLLAAFAFAGLALGLPLAGTPDVGLASRADYHRSVINNSTDLAARFVHSSTPPACTGTNVFCMTKVSMGSERVRRRHLTRSSLRPSSYQTGKNALVPGSYHTFGRPQAWGVSHNSNAWRTVAFTEGVAGSVEFQCNNKANIENHVKINWGFSMGGTSYVSTSTDVAFASSSDGKFLPNHGSLESDAPFVDFMAWCKDF